MAEPISKLELQQLQEVLATSHASDSVTIRLDTARGLVARIAELEAKCNKLIFDNARADAERSRVWEQHIAKLKAALRKMLAANDGRHDWLDAVCEAREALGEGA